MDAVADRAIKGLGTTEDDWLSWLARHPPRVVHAGDLVPHRHRAVVVAPHPDDEVLAVGGLLAQLTSLHTEVLLVAVTDGTASHPGSAVWTPQRLADERPKESESAWQRLGLHAPQSRRLNLADGGVGTQRAVLAREIAALLRPTDVIFTTWRHDGHPDHEATGQACAAAAACMGARLIEVPVWAWHWAPAGDMRLPWRRAVRVLLDPATAARKRDAVAAFASQLSADTSTGAGPILRSTTVQRAHRPFEVFFV